MKRRITFIPDPEHTVSKDQLQIEGSTLRLSSLKAAREERWTASLNDLPQRLGFALKQCYELHVRWTSSTASVAHAPFVSDATPGLNILLKTKAEQSAYRPVMPLDLRDLSQHDRLQTAGGKKRLWESGYSYTESHQDVFTKREYAGKSVASPPMLQYHELLPSITQLANYIQEKVCLKADLKCHRRAASILSAGYVDIDYDTISQTVVLGGFWHAALDPKGWTETISSINGQENVEIGILAKEKAVHEAEISLGGQLITLGGDPKPKPALFSFPSRHHVTSTSFISAFLSPTGLHPTLRLSFPQALINPPLPGCRLHAYLTLPPAIFPDKYQLAQPNLLRANNIASLRALSPRKPDLEAPVWAVKHWGTAVLFELAPPTKPKAWHADIPLHLRYLPPIPFSRAENFTTAKPSPSASTTPSLNASAHRRVAVAPPLVFFACPITTDGPEMDTSPFDRRNLGYDNFFGVRTAFWHLQRPSPASGGLWVDVPVLNLDRAAWVESGTVAAVLLGFAWACWCLWRVWVGEARRREGKAGKGE